MKLIGFTTEFTLHNEVDLIKEALDCGLDYIHVRKPSWSELEIYSLISNLTPEYLSRVVIHDHFILTSQLSIGGVHLNRRSQIVPTHYKGRISRSCHSLDELAAYRELTYCTLSPIFNAISKCGYMSNFSLNELENAKKSSIIGENTIALGGICDENITKIAKIGFGGAAILGYLWQDPTIEGVAKRVKSLRVKIDNIYV